MAIGISTHTTGEELFGRSHWWGFPDLPDRLEYPVRGAAGAVDADGTEDTLTFICQIRLEDIAPLDEGNLLPHKGMLYFFAAIDYFLGDMDACGGPLGFWDKEDFKVIYAPRTENLVTHKVQWPDGSDAALPAEAMSFHKVHDGAYGHKMLGIPYYEEVAQEAPGCLSLLQIDEDDRWGLRLYDLGNLNMLITPEALASADFSDVKLYFHCL